MREVKIVKEEEKLIAMLPPEIDHHSAKWIREGFDKRINEEKPREAVLDFSGVEFMDSSGLGLILGRARITSDIGATLTVKGLSPKLYTLIKLSGIEKIKNIKLL